MRNLLMLPSPKQAANDYSNSINRIVHKLDIHLPAFGYQLVESEAEADFVAGHAGQAGYNHRIDIAHCHGLYWTAYPNLTEPWHISANQAVVNNLSAARAVTAPSEWVADVLRRDMHLDPVVIPWAIDFEEWEPGKNQGYVLWNKTRRDGVCDPKPITELSQRVPSTSFVSTFADNPSSNLRVIGRQTFDMMKPIIQNAGVYLATTKETFCIGALEAMACGVPVLGYRHGNVPNLIQHGITGYLVEPGDIQGLVEGLAYCQKHRAVLGENAREVARLFTWQMVAERIAREVYDPLFEVHEAPKISVVIPHYNYANYVGEALESVTSQVTSHPFEVIVVDDGSRSDQLKQVQELVGNFPNRQVTLIEQPNGGVASARNTGIVQAKGEYIVCLDADDRLGSPEFLQTLADALDTDRSLGIVFTKLQTMDENGTLGAVSAWPNGFDWDRQIAGANCVPTCCMFRRAAWKRAGGFRAQYQPSEDAELWLRIVSLGYWAKQVTDAPWFQYRIHSGSLSDSIRQGQRPEPDWRTDKPWINDKQFPFAANEIARPVRNYDRPKVTVIIPVAAYHIPYLGQALDSVERQTERYWECIVVNDTGSPLPGLAPYPWAKVIDTGGNRGAGYARNLGVKKSTAPFVTFLDADDFLLPKFLELTLKKYQETGRYIYTDWYSINKEGATEGHATPEFVAGDVFSKPTPHAVNVLVKKAWHDQCGGFDEAMTTWEDVDYFMRLAKAGICGARVGEPLFVYRYLTGQRRENGERIKSQIIAQFNERYQEYISGGKMCGCQNHPPAAQLTQQGGAPPAAGQLIRISYQGAPGQHAVAFDKTNYGYRKKGDIFYVKAEHVTQFPQLFTPIAEVFEEKVTTPVPPPPPVIRQASTEAVLA